ncbi:hypothetical protein [Humidisolicoccus flavus]|uniref:hypothetical protein n=1 Tax=Humidisolicoccus flavus TaxID=3111414 RepID=UPI00324CF3D8
MRGSKALGVVLVALFCGILAACVPLPVSAPTDPSIPGAATPVFTNLTAPPNTQGPTEPPVPTDAPGDYAIGDTVTIHTSMGSTWEITVLAVDEDATSLVSSNGYSANSGTKFLAMEVRVVNVGVVTTHPYYDIRFGVQPVNGPVYNQSSASLAAHPDDFGYSRALAPQESSTGWVLLNVPNAATIDAWVISGDAGQTEYRFK